MSASALDALCRVARARTGHEITPALRARLERAYGARLGGSSHAWIGALAIAGDDHESVAELVTATGVCETWLFREADALRAAARHLVARAQTGRATAWSAGCATGEEAYSLALAVAHGSPSALGRISIVGTDVSARAIAVARAGRYPAAALASLPAGAPPPPVVRDPDGMLRFAGGVREACRFVRARLDAEPPDEVPPAADVVLCRNVLFYLTDASRRRAVDALVARLAPGGLLALGHAEALRVTHPALARVERDGCLFLEKAAWRDRPSV